MERVDLDIGSAPGVARPDQAFILATAQRRVIGNLGKLDMLRADDPTDQQRQGVDVLLLMAASTHLGRLHQGTFDGTIGMKGHVHWETPVDSFAYESDRIPRP